MDTVVKDHLPCPVTVARCANLVDALRVRAMLEAYGVAAFLPDEMVAGLMPAVFLYPEGVRVQVSETQATEARLLLVDAGVEIVPEAAAGKSSEASDIPGYGTIPGPAGA
jgi:Putative prokaryotic signal transducing protein